MAALALENWAAIGAWRVHDDHLWLAQGAIDASIDQMLSAAEPGAEHGGAGGAKKEPVLLSLFDGMGTARLAVDDMLRALRCSRALVASFFAETDGRLGDAVQGVWE
eukprot:11175565-Lingulodinium_polyedra.AAC.1